MLASCAKITPPALDSVLLKEFAEYLNFSGFSAPVAELKNFLSFAISAVEQHTKRAAFRADYLAIFRAESERTFRLPVFPCRLLHRVTIDGVEVAGELIPGGGGYSVAVTENVTGTVEISFSAGYDDAYPLPEVYKAAIFAIGADLYEHRESQSEISLHENRTVKFILQSLDMP